MSFFVLSVSLVLFSLFLLLFIPGNSSTLSLYASTSMVLDIVEGEGRGGEGGQKVPKFT